MSPESIDYDGLMQANLARVFGERDASRRMTAAGAVPVTWLAVAGEWQRDWAREKSAVGLAGVLAEHGGASGVAFAWEMQLLAGRAGAGA